MSQIRTSAKASNNPDDRSKCCVKCGETGHLAKSCDKNPSCSARKKKGRENTDHQIGGKKCPLYQEAYKSTKMRVMQLNLNHCEAAQEFLKQTVYEKKVDVALLSEQYKNISDATWISDSTNKAYRHLERKIFKTRRY